MHNFDISLDSCIESNVDPDQLASKKPAGQDPYCFLLSLYVNNLIGTTQVNFLKNGRSQ